jgi:hypothetical protein
MRAAPRPKPIRETEEVRLVDGVQHLDDGALDDLVLQRSDTERPQPPVRLRDVDPPRGLRSKRSPVQPCVQVVEIVLQLLPVRLPRHPVHPRRSARTNCPVGRPQAIDSDVMQERREPCFLVLPCDSAHTIQRT